ncbi:SRPBCC domain-containing protein [Micromonospora sp. M12]
MIEIGAQIELSHPPDRVWRALTDRELLGRWFAEAETVEGVPDRLMLRTSGLPGFEADVEVEVTERQESQLLVLACDEAGRLSELTCTITLTRQGCRLEVREVTTHGAWSAEQHEPREQQLRQALTVRLPAILDWLAFQQVDLRRGDGGLTAELPLIGPRGRSGHANRRRRTVIAVVAGAVLVAGTAAWITMPSTSKPAAAPHRPPHRRRACRSPQPPSRRRPPRRRGPRGPRRRRPPARVGPRRRNPRVRPRQRRRPRRPRPQRWPVTRPTPTDCSATRVRSWSTTPAAHRWGLGSGDHPCRGHHRRRRRRCGLAAGRADHHLHRGALAAGRSQTISFDVRDSRPKAGNRRAAPSAESPARASD